MKRRLKLIFSIISLSLAMSFLVLGVYAAATARLVSLSGDVSFEVENVNADITVRQSIPTAAATPTFANVGTVIEYRLADATQPNASRSLGSLNFTDSKINYVIEVKIDNKFPTGGRKIELIVPDATPLATHITATRAITAGSTNWNATNKQLNANSSITFTYTYVLNPNMSSAVVNAPISLQFSLRAI